ncbi:DUF1707 SHOCT-like domain-containing protein [Spirochaeta isovalerica]|uniref:DUF1707 domain-containing protein n=1 Tax=Spirochaeta isovalerica TaxID=150 RepID=A0A841RII1_9SPIO|nr:DUF1707 domain-containing protein [Spirochaeta isovalerica]MBB6482112.1 hypothetical protein [Spirochaeta isovalerica]
MISIEEMRDRTVKRLEYSYAHGEISLEELEKRIELAINTDLKEDLERLVSDLKEEEPEVKDEPSSPDEREETIMGVLSGIKRKGKWKPARRNKIMVFMGGVELDFTEAELEPGTTEYEYFCALGGIELRVPEGVNVDVSGLPLLAGIENKLSGDFHPGNPTIKLHGTLFLGGIEIKPSKRKKRR